MAPRSRRVLVTLNPETLVAVDRFRRSEEMATRRCPRCGAVSRMDGLPSETAALQRLVEIALDRHDARAKAIVAGPEDT